MSGRMTMAEVNAVEGDCLALMVELRAERQRNKDLLKRIGRVREACKELATGMAMPLFLRDVAEYLGREE